MFIHCHLEIDVNKTCNSTGTANQCKDPMSTCIDVSGTHRCTCNDEYYNKNGTCTISKYFSIFTKITKSIFLFCFYIFLLRLNEL